MTVLSSQGPEDWLPSDVITVKASSSRSGSFDKFSLSNTAGLVGRILKTDVIWLIFEKASKVTTLPIKNAFDLLKSAANSKVLPEPIQNPFNQKQTLFNSVLGFLKNQNVTFNKADCMGRVKNQRTGAATELVYEVTEIVWKVGQVEKQLRNSSLWGRVPKIISDLANFEVKSKDPIHMTQTSTKTFATHIREVASKAIMASQNLTDLKLALLSCAEIFIKYSEYLRVHLEKVKNKAASDRSISTATEALLLQLSNREKVSLVEVGEKPLQNETVISIFTKLDESGLYNPVNISTILPTNRYSRSTIIHRDLPNQARKKFVLWTFDNGRAAPQSIFAFLVDPDDSLQTILEKTNKLKPNLQKLQKFYYPREFYSQFYDQIGAVTGISSQDLKLVCSMVMGDDRKFDGDVKKRFEEAVMSGDPEYVYDMRNFNGSDIKYKDYLAEFRRAVQEYMVEDRGRHETKYDGTVVSKVSFGFSIKQMFKTVCEKVREKNPNCPLPKSEHMISRYLIPRTKAAAESACQSEPLIPLKLAMQQKVIEKPNVDAHYNAAQYKYLKSFATKLGPELVSMVGWDDKTGVDIGETEQPTVATQHAGKSWVHKEKVVAEGQHSFHKTNLTPSVRLVHEIGSSVEESFYRGLPQVVIKDAIFQHSTSARHATELFQMYRENPHLAKPVLILTNDGGNDHTIRHDRNIVSMLALFLTLPDTLFLVNFQLAAYRSAYHPVEKLNCILNLAWNGVALSRELLEDPVLEKVFSQCNSMSDVRAAAERHPGIKPALQKSLDPSIKILEERAKQASLKENSFETFKPATDQDIRDFLSVVLTIDPGFDVERYLDKKKPFHMSPLVKAYIEDHMTSTYYSLTFMKHPTMTEVFLRESYPTLDWPAGLEPLPCPIVDKENPEKYLSYEKVSDLLVKDYSDSSRPGAVKTPSNIPFTKSKPRAFFGAKLNITCDVCSKSRVAYIEHRPSEAVLGSAKKALLNVKYICGGRIASFGRSLTVLEEIYDATTGGTEVLDEIELDRPTGREMNIMASTSFDVIDEFDDLFSPGPVRKKKKMIIESDDSESEVRHCQDAAGASATVPGPSSQGGLGEEGALVGTTTPSGPSPPLLRGVCSLVPGSMSELFHNCPLTSESIADTSPGLHLTFQTHRQGLNPVRSGALSAGPELSDPVRNNNSKQDHLPQLKVEHAVVKQSGPLSPLQIQTIMLEGATEDMNGAIQLLINASQNPHLTDADVAVIRLAATEMQIADSIIQSHLQCVQQQELSGVSQPEPLPVPYWMEEFIRGDHWDPAWHQTVPTHGSHQTSTASQPTPSLAQAAAQHQDPEHGRHAACQTWRTGIYRQPTLQSPGAQTAYPQQCGVQSPGAQAAYQKQYGSPAALTAYHWSSTNPTTPALPPADCVRNSWSHLATPPQQQLSSQAPTTTPAPAAAARGSTPLVQVAQGQPWHAGHPQTNQLFSSAGELGYHQPAVPQLSQLPAPWPNGAPLPTLLHQTSSPPHSSCTSNKGVINRFHDYMNGDESDDSGLSVSYDLCNGCEPALCSLCTLYNGSHATQPLSGTSQQYAPQFHPSLVPFSTYPNSPYPANNKQYNQQQFTTQHMTQVISNDDNSVFVSDGFSWKEYNLEKVFSW